MFWSCWVNHLLVVTSPTILGIQVMKLGKAAKKFKQHQKKTPAAGHEVLHQESTHCLQAASLQQDCSAGQCRSLLLQFQIQSYSAACTALQPRPAFTLIILSCIHTNNIISCPTKVLWVLCRMQCIYRAFQYYSAKRGVVICTFALISGLSPLMKFTNLQTQVSDPFLIVSKSCVTKMNQNLQFVTEKKKHPATPS